VKADTQSVVPKHAAAVILLRPNTNPGDPEIFWVKRSEKMSFLGGFHAFPGGQFEDFDAAVPVLNCTDRETQTAISCAARELFEELGVLVTQDGNLLTKGQRLSLLDELQSGRMRWPALLNHFCLSLDAHDFAFVGRWLTPPFSARRFDTWFFLVTCPVKQQPEITSGELSFGEWTTATKALHQWHNSEILAVPPTLHALKTLAAGLTPDLNSRFLSIPQAHGEPVRQIEFRPGYICFPVRSPTRPPATHTNCYLVYSSREILIIDPGSPYADEQKALNTTIDELAAEGRIIRAIVLTHLHPDHVGGVAALKRHFGIEVPVAAHRLTAEALRGTITIEHLIDDSEIIKLAGSPGRELTAIHTPGHARGHLCFYEERTGTLISGDNILGLGSVLIDPPEGNMRDYLGSLERLGALRNLTVIFGGHGPAIGNPRARINEYISHRLEREQNILLAIRAGVGIPKEIVARVYTDVSPKVHALAERAVLAHLEKLQEDGLVKEVKGVWLVNGE